MQQKFYCQVRDHLLKIFKVRKHLIRNNKEKKDITLTEVEILEQEFSLVFTDTAAAKFLIKHYVTLVFYIKPDNKEWIWLLNDLLNNAKIILK